jgi:hypothetical protein
MHENVIKANQGQNRGYPCGCIGDGKPVARIAGGYIQCNQNCNAGRVDALNRRQIQIEGLAARQRL